MIGGALAHARSRRFAGVWAKGAAHIHIYPEGRLVLRFALRCADAAREANAINDTEENF